MIDRQEQLRRLKSRNRALALGLAAFALLFFVLTLVKLGGNAWVPAP